MQIVHSVFNLHRQNKGRGRSGLENPGNGTRKIIGKDFILPATVAIYSLFSHGLYTFLGDA